uniref:Uncharacterized protein n=1 Tax=Romanomermis culicivorax TaxID=13658 RepID=A0A915HTM7_ROMCU
RNHSDVALNSANNLEELENFGRFENFYKIDNADLREIIDKDPEMLWLPNECCTKQYMVKNFGLLEAGLILYEKFMNAYRSMIDEYQMRNVETPANAINTNDETLKQFIFDTMNTVEGLLIHGYDALEGFTRGSNATLQYTQAYYVSQTWPIFIRRALAQAMPEMLARVLQPQEIANETNLLLWEKLYRVLEQCVIINILEL